MTHSPPAPLDRELAQLVKRSGAITALLITKEGHNMAQAGDVTYLNVTAMAALVAAMFRATREVAIMVGEDQFSILLQQGETRHIHISLVTDATMMVIIFEDYQRIGRVRHEARRSGHTLAKILSEQQARPNELVQDIPVPEFKEYALNLIDRIFMSK